MSDTNSDHEAAAEQPPAKKSVTRPHEFVRIYFSYDNNANVSICNIDGCGSAIKVLDTDIPKSNNMSPRTTRSKGKKGAKSPKKGPKSSSSTAGPSTQVQGHPEHTGWLLLFSKIQCKEHGSAPTGYVRAGDSSLSWEHVDGGMNVYFFSRRFTPAKWLKPVAPGVYANTDRELVSTPSDDFIGLTNCHLTVAGARLYHKATPAAADDNVGQVLIGPGKAYIITSGSVGDALPIVDFSEPGETYTGAITCSACVRENFSVDTSDADSEDNTVYLPIETMAPKGPGRPKRRLGVAGAGAPESRLSGPELPDYVGERTTVEWVDYWGTRYYKHTYENVSYLVCRDISLVPRHVPDSEGMREIYPDICSRLETINLATASFEYPCIYTDDGTGHAFCHCGRQTFMRVDDGKLVVMRAHVIRTKNRLISGQCVYYWSKGWSPYYAANVRVCSIITVGRKVGNYYYSAIVNGSTHYHEYITDNNASILRVDYIREREVEDAEPIVAAIEEKKFRCNTMYRLLSARRRVIASWTEASSVEYSPWDYEFFALPRGRGFCNIVGASVDLERKIRKAGGLNFFLQSVEDMLIDGLTGGKIMLPLQTCSVCFTSTGALEKNSIIVRLVESGTPSIRLIGGEFILRGTVATISDSVGIIAHRLWTTGFQAITWTGDIKLVSRFDDHSLDNFFVGCETARTPLIIFCDDHGPTLELVRSRLVERNPSVSELIVRADELHVHSDWKVGAAKMRTSSLSDNSLASLAAWRMLRAAPPEELIFNLQQASADALSPEEVCDVGPGDWWAGEVYSALDAGSCFGSGSELVSSYHVTYGQSVVITRAGLTYTWDKIFHKSSDEDIVVYGDRNVRFASASEGEILCAVCPTKGVGKFLIVEKVRHAQPCRGDALFYEMRPIDIDPDFNHVVASEWKGIHGMSGSPIVNSKGEIVSVYGLGRIEDRAITTYDKVRQSGSIDALTVLAPDTSSDASPQHFFKSAVLELLNTTLVNDEKYFLVEAPTGSGKTMNFTSQLLDNLRGTKRIYLLQPTVAAVKGAYSHLVNITGAGGRNSGRFTVSFVVGQQHMDHSDSTGTGSIKLTIMSYGTALRRALEIINEADFVLLDEIHCRSDPTVVAGDLQFTVAGSRYKCVHLTATVLTRTGAYPLARGLEISGTRFPISESLHIEPLKAADAESTDWWIIPKNVIGTRHDGFRLGYRVPTAAIKKGRVVFFLASRGDCESLAKHAKKTLGPATNTVVIHGGTTFNVEELPDDALCFCTDVVGQAVTIPGCTSVVDFMEEIKPETRLEFNGESLLYSYRLVRRTIGMATAQQRKGRTGRTHAGLYVAPVGVTPNREYGVDRRTAAIALLELEASKRLVWDTIEKHHNLELVAELEGLKWILPANLATSIWCRNTYAFLQRDRRVKLFEGKKQVGLSLKSKLELLRDINGDLLYLYLTPVMSEELKLFKLSSELSLRTSSLASDADWYRRYFDFCWLTKTENDRTNVLSELDTSITSFLEQTSFDPDANVTLLAEIGLSSGATGQGEYVQHSATSMLGGTAVALGATAVIISSVYSLTIKNLNRYVTRVFPFRSRFAASQSKHLAVEYAKNPEGQHTSKLVAGKALEAIMQRKDSVIGFFKNIGLPVGDTVSHGIPAIATVIAGAEKLLCTYWAAVPVTFGVGAFPGLAAIMTSTWVGATFSSLEKVLGRALSVSFLGILNGMCLYFTTLPLAIASCVAQIIGFVVKGLCSGAAVDYDIYGRTIGSSDRAWDLIFGMGAGVGVAYLIKNQLFLVAQAASTGVLATTANASLGVAYSRSGLFGSTGNALVFVKQVYLIFTRVQDGNLPWDSMGAAITAILQALSMDMTTAVLGVILSLSLIAVRTGLKTVKYQAGVSCKSTRPVDGTNTYVEEYFGSFDNFAMTVLSAGSCLASPSSIISVIIAWIGNCCRRGDCAQQNFRDAFEAYSGVPIAVAILSEGLVSLGRAENYRRDSVDIFTLALGVPSFIAGVFGCVYWAKNPTVVHALTSVWDNIKGFFTFAWKFAKDSLTKVVTSIGNCLGSGLVAGVVEKLPKWCQPKTKDTVLEEKFSLIRSEPAVVNEWFHQRVKQGRVSIIERLHYSRPICRLDHYGTMPLPSFAKFLHNLGQGMSVCRKYNSPVPFEFFCVTAEDLGSIVSCFASSVSIDGNSLKLTRGDCAVSIELAFQRDVATHFIKIEKGYVTISFLLVSMRQAQGSVNYVVAYRAPSGLLDLIFGKLACLHPGIEAVSGSYDNIQPEEFMLATNHLCRWSEASLKFEWHRGLTNMCLGMIDKAAGVFGLVNKINENEFDLGLIPGAWCSKPKQLSIEEWEMYQWLLWSHYESGLLLTTRVDNLWREKHLPSRLLDCCTSLWRRVEDAGRLDSHCHSMEKFAGEFVSFSRNTDASDPKFRQNGSGFSCTFDLGGGLDATDNWAHCAWWAGLNVYYSFNDTLCLCTLGGYCGCSAIIAVSNKPTLGFVRCATHMESWRIQTAETLDVKPIELTRDTNELTSRLNAVLEDWYTANPWRRGIAKPTPDIGGRDSWSARHWLQDMRKMWSSDATVNHSESLLADVIASIGRLYDLVHTKTDHKRKAVSLLEDWNSSVVTSSISAKRALLDEKLAEVLVDVSMDVEQEDDSDRFRYLLGYAKPNIGVAHGWKWLKTHDADLIGDSSDISAVIKAGKDTNKFASRLQGLKWAKMERLARVELPKRSDAGGVYSSRGGFKMQQLHEADPMFFENAKVILDPCCGFGGFAEYFSQALAKKSPKIYLMSTLFEKGHRVPVGEIRQVEHSNVTISLVTNPDSADRGNIKDSRCLARLIGQAKGMGGHDLLLLDAGEYSFDGNKNRSFWLSKTANTESFLSSAVALVQSLNDNGKACIKINGLWHGVDQVVHELSRGFLKVKGIKLGTAPLSSPEWYLICDGYKGINSDVRRAAHLVQSICEEQRFHYLLMQQIIRVRGRGWKTIKRGDWFEPGRKSSILQTMLRADNKPPGIKIDIETPVGKLNEEWNPNWDERLQAFEGIIRKRKMKYVPSIMTRFDHVCSAGTIIRKRKSQQPKNTKNGLISEFVGRVWAITDTNSTVCHTQSTDKWKESSRKKRLDVNPGQMDSGALAKVYEALQYLTSSYGKSVKGTCKLLTKDEVESMVNNQGSTGALDAGHNLGEYMLLNADWYDKALQLISHWEQGKSTNSYFTCRPKNEPKKKKCVEDGKLVVSNEEELLEYNEQGHRFIQFADAQTRLAHYVLFGDMLKKGSKQKLYKGTINGTPPMYMGRVIRSMWDMNSPQCNREIKERGDPSTDVNYQIFSSEKLGGEGEVTGICLDYSGWDTTVTLGERIIEADFCAGFYPATLRRAIMNCLMETSCPITVDDDGNVWLRAGQRGSGEILTSFGNTALVAANTAVAVAACTGLSIREVCETVAEIEYVVGYKNGLPVKKRVEVTRFCQMSDGDDTFLVTTKEWATAIVNNIEEVLTLQKKAIRSGEKGGAKICARFEDLIFKICPYYKNKKNTVSNYFIF